MNDGILVIKKEEGMTSRDVVNKLNHIFHMKKIGHTGTLDPMATGVLVVCLGKATKLVDIITASHKEYIATMKLGIKTDTYDITGNIIDTKDLPITKEQVLEALHHFEGKYEQEVPIYSAVKVAGKKLYEYARKSVPVVLPKREVEIKTIELLSFQDDIVEFKVLVSKGTYIRSLINDIGAYLGCNASMYSLCRTIQGNFTLDNSYTLEDIENNDYKIYDITEIVKIYPSEKVSGEKLKQIKNGAIIDKEFGFDLFVYYEEDNPIAIYKEYEKDGTKAKPYIML